MDEICYVWVMSTQQSIPCSILIKNAEVVNEGVNRPADVLIRHGRIDRIDREIRAAADKERTIILAEAKKNSDITRGNGEAESNKIYANSYGRDPEFADFYRSMSAYKEALNSEKTKMVISPDGEYFKYFGNK